MLKKPTLSLIFVVTCLLSGFSQGLSGYYTIGSSPSNYATVSAAITDLDTNGLAGPVVFMIKPGSYKETLALDSVPGMSATNTITITTDTASSTLAELWNTQVVVWLYNTKHVRIERLKLRTTRSTNVMQISGKTVDLIVRNNEFKGYTLAGSSRNRATIYEYGGSYNDALGITIENNKIHYGTYGIYAEGWAINWNPQKHLKIKNNTIDSFMYCGVHIEEWDSIEVVGNTIKSPAFPANYGFYIERSSNFEIHNNKVLTDSNYIARGMYFDWSNTRPGMKGWVYNNFIDVGGSHCAGLYTDVSDSINFAYNTIIARGTDTSFSQAMRFYNSKGIRLENNNISAVGGGFCLLTNTNGAPYYSNHNNFFTTGKYVAWINSGKISNLATWKLLWGTDSNSLSVNPSFALSPPYLPTNSALGDTAKSLSWVQDDIEGSLRGNRPDIGCMEFQRTRNNASLIPLDSAFCKGQNPISFNLLNAGGNAISSAKITWSILRSGSVLTQGVTNFSGFLPSGADSNLVLSTLGFGVSDSFLLFAFVDSVNGVPDTENSGDTISGQLLRSQFEAARFNAVSPVCNNADSFRLASIPLGGTFIGSSVNANYFNPLLSSPGTDTLTLFTKDSSGCKDTTELYLQILAIPHTSWASSPNFCENGTDDSLTFALPKGGTYKGPGISNNVFSPSALSPGTYASWYVAVDSNSCMDSVLQNITVSRAPKVSQISNPKWCQNHGIDTLRFFSPAGGSYKGPSLITDSTIEVSVTTPRQFDLKYIYSDSLGCMDSGNVNVTLDSLTPLIASKWDSICFADHDTLLTQFTPTGGRYSGSFVNNGQFQIGWAAPGNHWVKYDFTNAKGCHSSDSTAISVLALPELGLMNDTTICEGDRISIEVNSGLSTYLWSNGDTGHVTMSNSDTLYWIEARDKHGCSARDSVILNRKDCSTGLADSQDVKSWKLFPNPSSEVVHLKHQKNWNGSIQILNPLGQVIYERSGTISADLVFDVSSWSSGLYTIQLNVSGEFSFYRLVVR